MILLRFGETPAVQLAEGEGETSPRLVGRIVPVAEIAYLDQGREVLVQISYQGQATVLCNTEGGSDKGQVVHVQHVRFF